MMNEPDILKYLDKELSEKEREAFEKHLTGNTEFKSKVDEVKAKRQTAFDAINMLNPPEPVVVPDFNNIKFAGNRRKLSWGYRWRVAAAILILAISAIGYFTFQSQTNEKEFADNVDNAPVIEEFSPCSEADYYISPNRCWHRRQLIFISISNHP